MSYSKYETRIEHKALIVDLAMLGKIPNWKDLKVEAFRLELDTNNVFMKLDEKIINEEWNGIGPDRFPAWLRVILSHLHHLLLPAVLIHDLDYVIGGTKEEFYAANLRLKNNMMKCLKANRKNFSLLGYWIERKHIKLFYKLCNKYGLDGWNLKIETL